MLVVCGVCVEVFWDVGVSMVERHGFWLFWEFGLFVGLVWVVVISKRLVFGVMVSLGEV